MFCHGSIHGKIDRGTFCTHRKIALTMIILSPMLLCLTMAGLAAILAISKSRWSDNPHHKRQFPQPITSLDTLDKRKYLYHVSSK